MKSVLITNQKGGVGKSLLADAIAFSLDHTGTPYNFIDLDDQGGTIHTTTNPIREDAVAQIVDTPGALSKDLRRWMSAADIIVIPFRPTSRDIPPLLRMIDIADSCASGRPVLYVMNGWNRYKASRDFEEWFREQINDHPDVEIAIIPQSELFVQASAAGVSIEDFAPRSTAAKSMRQVTDRVRAWLGV